MDEDEEKLFKPTLKQVLLNFYIEARNEFHDIPDTKILLSDLDFFIEGWILRNLK